MKGSSWSVASALLFFSVVTNAGAPIRIPLVEGLLVTTAIAEPDGDYESHKQLLSRDGDAWRLGYSASVPQADGAPRRISSERILHDEDLRAARSYRSRFEDNAEEDYPGTTAWGPSAEVFTELKSAGSARFALIGEEQWLARALGGASASALDMAAALMANPNASFKGELRRTSTGTLDVLVNGAKQSLDVIEAAGRFVTKSGLTMEATLSFLDDVSNPIALRWRIGTTELRVVRIEVPVQKGELARELKSQRHIVLPGLLFDFGAASLRPESTAALPAIAEAIRSVPDAVLSLDGHTDNIGDAQRNQRLSLARAEAVRSALVRLDAKLAERLVAKGHGATRPVASNATLQGRAQNRRVELSLP